MAEMLHAQAEQHADETALIRAESGESVSYAELDDAAADVARTLADVGVGAGSHVALVFPNSIELVTAICGLLKLGAVAVPVNPEYRGDELAYVLDQSDAEAVVAATDLVDAVSDVGVGESVRVVTPDDYAPADGDRVGPDVRPVDTAFLMFTSGTTGDPKAVAHSHSSFLTRLHAGEMPRGYDTFYTMLPLYNIDGYITTFGTLYDGGEVLLRDGFSASAFWDDVTAYGGNVTSGVPSILSILTERGPIHESTPMETFVVSGSFLSTEVTKQFEATFDVDVMEIYGLSEVAGTTHESPEQREYGSAGVASRYAEMQVVDEESREPLPAGERGEIRIRGPTLFKEYYNNQTATEEVFEGTWFCTGDIGYYDENGEYYVSDRIKNIIIRGGQNIFPGDIEETIHELPEIEDVGVVGRDHEIYGEVPVAYVTVEGDHPTDEIEALVMSHCRESLVDFKVPADVHVVEQFPRGETGKILKTELE